MAVNTKFSYLIVVVYLEVIGRRVPLKKNKLFSPVLGLGRELGYNCFTFLW